MTYDLLVRGGLLVSSGACIRADILIHEGKIAAIGKDFSTASVSQTIDAEGRYVLPGAVDGHVHLMDPGYTDREDALTGSMTAARGGVTTIIDHHRSNPQVFDADIFDEKKRYLQDSTACDPPCKLQKNSKGYVSIDFRHQ